MSVPPPRDEYFLDPVVVRRSFDRASATFDRYAVIHAELRARLLERLDVVRLSPGVVVDLGSGTGHGARALQERYSSARVVALDVSLRMLDHARRQQKFFKRFDRLACDAHALALQSTSVDLVFSNLMLQWCADPDAVFREVARVLKPGGLLMFTTLGPDTLRELRASWDDGEVHVHRFIDMHDLGDALMRAGFAEPVMDTERLTITYRDLPSLLGELKGSGSTNVAAGRARGLRSLRPTSRHYPTDEDRRLPVTLEVVYGHAWAGAQRRMHASDGIAKVPVDSIRWRKR